MNKQDVKLMVEEILKEKLGGKYNLVFKRLSDIQKDLAKLNKVMKYLK